MVVDIRTIFNRRPPKKEKHIKAEPSTVETLVLGVPAYLLTFVRSAPTGEKCDSKLLLFAPIMQF